MSAKHSTEKFAAALRAKQLKATPIRLALLEALEKAHGPASIQEIIALLPAGIANQVTVYRALESFVEQGLAREVNLRHGHVDYESATSPDHHHLVCTTCGRMEDFDQCGMDTLIKNVLREHPSFASVEDHALELFGTCRSCANKAKK